MLLHQTSRQLQETQELLPSHMSMECSCHCRCSTFHPVRMLL
jgi:hypothetical protein